MNLNATGSKTRDWLFIFILGAIYRLVLLWQFPALYGGDSVGRLFYRDSIFFGHWLPLLQSLIVAGFDVTNSVMIIRVVIILAGSLSALGFYEFVRVISRNRNQPFSDQASWRRLPLIAGILFTLCPLYVYLSIVPYQEVIFLGLMFGGLAFLLGNEDRKLWGYLLYGLACLTRYEAWLLLPVLFFLEVRRLWHAAGGRIIHWIPAFKLLLALGWAPLVWMLLNEFHWGEFTAFLFQKEGSVYIWHSHFSLSIAATYLTRMLWWIVKYGSPLVLFAVPGIYFFRKERSRFPLPVRILGLLCLFVLVLLTFIAGPEFAHAHRFAAIPLSLVLIFTAVGIERFVGHLQQKRTRAFTILLPMVLIILSIYSAIPVARANQRPDNSTAYQVARFLDRALSANEKAVIVAQGFREYPQVIPMPYQRIAAQSNLNRNRMLSASHLGLNGEDTVARLISEQNVRYVVICSKFEPWRASDRFFMEYVKAEKNHLRRMEKGMAEVYELGRVDF
ncbi:hypothetical protein GWO43_12125 [candidate division KSB1 bacterium]|nr:hypothetical protein [candidate division KSB1 bacterium]NIR70965.1 hypothetical protein [candidate division KSB1 bacterium]NIS24701.1 hypothetical protein [candidate division KSB1 bacterium]NIT71610.1 hypothetical protein [candidate division KSB1 bacterium]NIU25314.1 hypothetical protein [candidate division KSB1 bacterium]